MDNQHGWQLLLKSQGQDVPAAIRTLKSRSSSEQSLGGMPASRASTFQNHETEHRRSLPGLGHPYWLHIRDHLTTNFPPPTLDVDLAPMMTIISRDIATAVVNLVENSWNAHSPDLFTCSFKDYLIMTTKEAMPVIRIPICRTEMQATTQYQNDMDMQQSNFIAFHGTRQALAPSILKQGLMSSMHSHGVTGLWVNSNVCTSLAWTSSIFDTLPSVAFEIIAPESAKRHNRRIKAGNPERMVV